MLVLVPLPCWELPLAFFASLGLALKVTLTSLAFLVTIFFPGESLTSFFPLPSRPWRVLLALPTLSLSWSDIGVGLAPGEAGLRPEGPGVGEAGWAGLAGKPGGGGTTPDGGGAAWCAGGEATNLAVALPYLEV